jgi:hypothetical protein
MTSNSPENTDPTERGAGRPSTGGPAAGGPTGGGSSGTPVRGPEPAGRPTVSGERTSTTGTDRAPASKPATGKDTRAAGKTGTASDKASGKSGTSRGTGGDWSVFRTVVIVVGVVIAGFGAYYLILGTAGLPETEGTPVNATLENQFRFFSAMMVGVGAAFITIAIKFQWANMLWLVCLMVFVGGIGRVLSWAFSGTPNYVMIILMVVELAFPPALLVWHKYIAKTSEMRQEFARRG